MVFGITPKNTKTRKQGFKEKPQHSVEENRNDEENTNTTTEST